MNDFDKIAEEFYAYYGLAMHTVQTLEHGLLIYNALWQYNNNGISKIDYLKLLAKPATLGQLKTKILENKVFNDSEIVLLDEVNKKRRFLAHRFWWERNINFSDNKHLEALKLEIVSNIRLFDSLNNILNKRIMSLRIENNIFIEKELGLDTLDQIRTFVKNIGANK
jgi:hypothetical protein